MDHVVYEVKFRNVPEEDDPYRDVNPAIAYELAKYLIEIGVEKEAILNDFVVTEHGVDSPA